MSRHILIVDDDPLLRRSLAFHLEQAGYRVDTAANAEDALALVRRSPPNLILLDIGLPGMDGLDALRELKTHHKFPVIFLTARRRGAWTKCSAWNWAGMTTSPNPSTWTFYSLTSRRSCAGLNT